MTLSVRQLNLSLAGVPLLDNVSLEVVPGQITTILGPNGAGKTSLLRALIGELAIDSGAVCLGDRDIKAWSSTLRAKTLAVLPQHSLLDFPFTASEVVMLGRTPHDTGVARDREIVAQALKAVDGDGLAARIYTQLSGGEKQRVHLARVLAQIWEPVIAADRYLVLDEPTSSFDLAHQQLTLEVVRDLAQKGVGVLMVIHDLNLAARCADQMVLLRDGQIKIAGAAEQVLTRENVADVFDVEVQIGKHPLSAKPLVIS